MTLGGKVIVVAGGGNGSGRECVLAYGRAGAAVAIGDIDMGAAEAVRDEIAALGGSATLFAFDNDDPDSVRALVEDAAARHGRIDGLHCISGNPTLHERDLGLLDADIAVWEDTFRNHFIAYATAAKAAIPVMMASGGGSIILTSSGQAVAADTIRLGYQVSKKGAEILSVHIARTYGKQGIRSNVLRYGLILSENARRRLSAEYIAEAEERSWVGRAGTVQDPVPTALFLMSDDAAFITGQVIDVAGGRAPVY